MKAVIDAGPVESYVTFLPGKENKLVMPDNISLALNQWITELGSINELIRYDLEPRKRLMLFGKPGCGKTSIAQNISTKLNKKLFLMKLAGIESKYVGESSKHLHHLFSSARSDNAIVFIDEIDSIGETRQGDDNKHYKNLTNTFLNELDSFDGIVIGATNMEQTIDPALWRRFDLHLEIPTPNAKARVAIVKQYLMPFKVSKKCLDNLSILLDGAGASVIKQIMNCLKRELVLSPKQNMAMDIEAVFSRIAASIKLPASEKAPFWDECSRNDFIKDFEWPLNDPFELTNV